MIGTGRPMQRSRMQLEFFPDAGNLVGQGLVAIDASAEFNRRGDARRSHGMDGFVAPLHGSEDLVPLAFDIGAIGVHFVREAGVADDLLAGDDVLGKGHAYPDGNDAEIDHHFHRGLP